MKYRLCFSPSRRFITFVSAFCCIVGCPMVFSQALTPEQLEKILQELKAIESTVDGKRISSRTNAVTAFQRAAASDKAALELYLDCYKVVHFDRQDAGHSDFRDWKEKNEEHVKDRGNIAALRIQLQYLVLTLRAAENVSMKTLVPELEAFASNVVASLDAMRQEGGSASSGNKSGGRAQGGRPTHGGGSGGGGAAGAGGGNGLKVLKQGVNNSVFAEAYELDKTLNVSNWVMSPANIGGIYEKTILPYFQASDPSNLPAAWDRRINLERAMAAATSTDNPTAFKMFESEDMPQLRFQKSCDLFRFVSQQQGALAILALLKENPAHSKAGEWLSEFRNLIAEAARPPATPAPAATNP